MYIQYIDNWVTSNFSLYGGPPLAKQSFISKIPNMDFFQSVQLLRWYIYWTNQISKKYEIFPTLLEPSHMSNERCKSTKRFMQNSQIQLMALILNNNIPTSNYWILTNYCQRYRRGELHWKVRCFAPQWRHFHRVGGKTKIQVLKTYPFFNFSFRFIQITCKLFHNA